MAHTCKAALGWRKENQEFKAGSGHTASSRLTWLDETLPQKTKQNKTILFKDETSVFLEFPNISFSHLSLQYSEAGRSHVRSSSEVKS